MGGFEGGEGDGGGGSYLGIWCGEGGGVVGGVSGVCGVGKGKGGKIGACWLAMIELSEGTRRR